MTGRSHISAHWDQRYLNGDAPWNSGIVSRELMRVLDEERVAPCRAVELGCGTGTNAVHLARLGFELLAADCSAVAIEQARARAHEERVTMQFVSADLCRLPDLLETLNCGRNSFEGQSSFLFDRGCYHCARRVDLPGYLETVDWLAAPGARFLLLCGNANEQAQHGPPKVSEAEIRADWSRSFEINWIREFRFEDRGGVPGPLGWSCYMTRRSAV